MQTLIELFEMVSLNDNSLSKTERQKLLKARLALSIFERAMQDLKAEATRATSVTEIRRRPAAEQFSVRSAA